VPKKKPRGGELTVEAKMENRRISRARVLVENIIAKFKVFNILANKSVTDVNVTIYVHP
jgi:hypothetical protein